MELELDKIFASSPTMHSLYLMGDNINRLDIIFWDSSALSKS